MFLLWTKAILCLILELLAWPAVGADQSHNNHEAPISGWVCKRGITEEQLLEMESSSQQFLLKQHEIAQQRIGLNIIRESDGSQNVPYQISPEKQIGGKDGFILVCPFRPSPRIYLLTVLGERAKGLQPTHYFHKQLCNKGPVL